MALGPNDLQLTDDEERHIGQLEKILDAALRDNYVGPDQPTVVILSTAFGWLTRRIELETIRHYRKAGWKKVEVSGSMWTFTP